MKRTRKIRISCMVCVLLLLLPLSGCGKRYTEADLLQLRQQAYLDGYHAGYDEGAEEASAQLEEQYQQGYDAGTQEGYAQGAQETQTALLETIGGSYQQGYETGYAAGYDKQNADADAARLAYLTAAAARTPAKTAPAAPTSPSPSSGSSTQPETPVSGTAPAEEPTTEPKEPSSENIAASSSQVYVTASGKKYHRSDCAYLTKSKQAISLADAKSKGYSPCSKCKPPQ